MESTFILVCLATNSHRILAKIWPLNHAPLSTSWVSTKGREKGAQICACGPSCLTMKLQGDKSDGGSVCNIEHGLAYMTESVDTG
jgi:hypothetical protein